jgi:cobalamin biosynthesis protein CbiG
LPILHTLSSYSLKAKLKPSNLPLLIPSKNNSPKLKLKKSNPTRKTLKNKLIAVKKTGITRRKMKPKKKGILPKKDIIGRIESMDVVASNKMEDLMKDMNTNAKISILSKEKFSKKLLKSLTKELKLFSHA